jgi:signal transduction histidine kinase
VAAQGVLLDITDREVERVRRRRLQELSIDLVAVQEAERRKIGLELHDEIGQTLTALKLRLGANSDVSREALERRLEEVEQLVDEAMEHVRELSQNLRPTVLDDLGLLAALLSYFSRYTRQNGIRVQFEHEGIERRRFAADVETAAYRIVQEALTNAARHANVEEVEVRGLGRRRSHLGADRRSGRWLRYRRGVGCRPHRGLAGMRERASLLHGSLHVESTPGQGARITGELPIIEKDGSEDGAG